MHLSTWRLLVMSFLPGRLHLPVVLFFFSPGCCLKGAQKEHHVATVPTGATCWPECSELRCQLPSHASNKRPALMSRGAILYFQTTTFCCPELAWHWWRDGKVPPELPSPDEDTETHSFIYLSGSIQRWHKLSCTPGSQFRSYCLHHCRGCSLFTCTHTYSLH